MADKRKEYAVTINGIEHNMLLNAEDAEHYGEAAVLVKIERAVKAAATPANKEAAAQANKDAAAQANK